MSARAAAGIAAAGIAAAGIQAIAVIPRGVVVAVPHRGVTANTGIEALADNLDVFAEEAPGLSIDLVQHQHRARHLTADCASDITPEIGRRAVFDAQIAADSHLQGMHTRLAEPSCYLCRASYGYAYGCPNTGGAGWYAGWRIEYGCAPKELMDLRAILALPDGAHIPFDAAGVDGVALIKKLHRACTKVAANADRFYAHHLQAYNHDIPQLRQRTNNAEQALAEANMSRKSIADKLSLTTARLDVAQPGNGNGIGMSAMMPHVSVVVASGGHAGAASELEALRRHRDSLVPVLRHLREALICPICTEVSLLPKVLGACGHVACQSCLKQLDEVAFASLTASPGGASARQHLMARRCPLCRTEIIAGGFPVHPLKDVASLLVSCGLIDAVDQHPNSAQDAQRLLEFKTLGYEKETAEARHIHALQLGCYSQSQLAQHSVSGVIATITREQWVNGVYILFEAAVSRVFFETFATTLHGKAGGVNVLVNSSQRMLAVQLGDKTKERRPIDVHVLVKVATDGRFSVGSTPDPNTGDSKQPGPLPNPNTADRKQPMPLPIPMPVPPSAPRPTPAQPMPLPIPPPSAPRPIPAIAAPAAAAGPTAMGVDSGSYAAPTTTLIQVQPPVLPPSAGPPLYGQPRS
jgi:hypothetical protein